MACWIRKNTNINAVLISLLIFILTLIMGCGGGDTGGSMPGKSVTLAWDSPTTNSDGSVLTTLAGFKLYYGTSYRSYTSSIDVENATIYKVSGLAAGTYHFAVTAYDIYGNESDYSDEVIANLE